MVLVMGSGFTPAHPVFTGSDRFAHPDIEVVPVEIAFVVLRRQDHLRRRRRFDGEGVLHPLRGPGVRLFRRLAEQRLIPANERVSRGRERLNIGRLFDGRRRRKRVLLELGVELHAIRNAAGHHVQESQGLAINVSRKRCAARRQGERREEALMVLRAEWRTRQQAQELLTGFDRHTQAHERARLGVHRLALDERFQRNLLRIELHRPGRAALRHVAREFGAFGAQSCGNRRAVVVPLQLTELPLPREQPEGIVDPRLQRFAL